MLDAHKVKDAMLDALMPKNQHKEVKEFLLEWLLNHGRDAVERHIAWGLEKDKWFKFEQCCERGYIDSLQDPFTRKYNHKLTDLGLEYINKGENNEQ